MDTTPHLTSTTSNEKPAISMIESHDAEKGSLYHHTAVRHHDLSRKHDKALDALGEEPVEMTDEQVGIGTGRR